VDGVLHRTDGVVVHLVVVDNGSAKPKTLRIPQAAREDNPNVTVLRHDDAFNYSRLVNVGAGGARSPYLLLLNKTWPSTTVLVAADGRLDGRPRSDAVGASSCSDGRIQHAGWSPASGGSPGLRLELEDAPFSATCTTRPAR